MNTVNFIEQNKLIIECEWVQFKINSKKNIVVTSMSKIMYAMSILFYISFSKAN